MGVKEVQSPLSQVFIDAQSAQYFRRTASVHPDAVALLVGRANGRVDEKFYLEESMTDPSKGSCAVYGLMVGRTILCVM
jgi:hypothetical protein